MKIVLLDGYSANPGDLNYDEFHHLGDFTFYDHTPREKVIQRMKEAEIVLTNKVRINKTILDASTKLKYIGLLSTGYNIIDIPYTQSKNVVVTNVPDYAIQAVAQHVFSLILYFYNQVAQLNMKVQNGAWMEASSFCFYPMNLQELYHKTIGIVGYGAIGRQVARIASAFDMQVLVYTRTPESGPQQENLIFTDLDALLKKSDIVSLHCPLTEDTRNLINSHKFAIMKRTAILINTARGPVVDESALVEALQNKQIFGAGLDVIAEEPMNADCKLLHIENCVITPHSAWAPKETRKRLLSTVYNNLKNFLEGNTVNQVN